MNCTIAECNNPIRANSLCRSHNMRLWRYGDPLGRSKKHIKHGMWLSPEYSIWRSMKQRCSNPNDKAFINYGARGIKVCQKWLDSFSSFYEDMGARPSDKHSIERKDVNGNYEPSNCKWATNDIQMHNRRPYNSLGVKSVTITPQGTYCVSLSHNGVHKRKTFKTLGEAKQGYIILEKELYV